MHETQPTAQCVHKRHKKTCEHCHPRLLPPKNRPQIRGLLPFVLRMFQAPFDALLDRDEIAVPRTLVPGLAYPRKVAVLKECARILGFKITVEAVGSTQLRVIKRQYDNNRAIIFV